MSADMEQMKKHLEFLVNERNNRVLELEQLKEQEKITRFHGFLTALSGNASMDLLRQQQIINRAQDISTEIRRLNFEIQNIESNLKTKEPESTSLGSHEKSEEIKQHICPSCGKDISQLPTEAKHCPFCGSKCCNNDC